MAEGIVTRNGRQVKLTEKMAEYVREIADFKMQVQRQQIENELLQTQLEITQTEEKIRKMSDSFKKSNHSQSYVSRVEAADEQVLSTVQPPAQNKSTVQPQSQTQLTTQLPGEQFQVHATVQSQGQLHDSGQLPFEPRATVQLLPKTGATIYPPSLSTSTESPFQYNNRGTTDVTSVLPPVRRNVTFNPQHITNEFECQRFEPLYQSTPYRSPTSIEYNPENLQLDLSILNKLTLPK